MLYRRLCFCSIAQMRLFCASWLTGPDAFVPVRLRVVCRGDVVPGFPMIRAQFESFARRLDRFVKLALLVESQRSVEISIRGRPERSCEHIGPRQPGRVGWEPGERLIGCLTKKIRLHPLRIDFHQQMGCVDVQRVIRYRESKVLNRFARPALSLQPDRIVVVGCCLGRLQLNSAGEVPLRFRVIVQGAKRFQRCGNAIPIRRRSPNSSSICSATNIFNKPI